MNTTIADIGNHDLKNATRVLYYTSRVLQNIPTLHVSEEDRTAIYASAKLAIQSVRIVLANIADQLETIEAAEVLPQ